MLYCDMKYEVYYQLLINQLSLNSESVSTFLGFKIQKIPTF